MSARRPALVLFAALLSVCGCGTGTRPFLMVQLCLHDAADLKAFVNEVHTAVAAEGLTFIDGSADTAQELKAVGYPNRERADGSPVINIGAEGRDGLGVMAGNTGLPGYQVALGFSEGRDPSAARQLAAHVVERLNAHWTVLTVPDGHGALPLKDCKP